MPELCPFRGIATLIFGNEGAHHVGHFQVHYAEFRASVGFDGSVIVGGLPRAQLKLVRDGARLHQAELAENWALCAMGILPAQSTPWPKLVPGKPILPPWLVRGVAVIGPHRLRLLFEDGTVGDVSFGDHDWKGSFEPLRDPERFAQVSIRWDTLYWAEDELDWAPEPLYEAAKANALTPVKSAA